MADVEESIILLVKERPMLYDASHPDYSKRAVKEAAWLDIARRLSLNNGEIVKQRWSKLRNCHREAVKRRITKCMTNSSILHMWKYERQMRFMLKHISNMPSQDDSLVGQDAKRDEYDQHMVVDQCDLAERIVPKLETVDSYTCDPSLLEGDTGETGETGETDRQDPDDDLYPFFMSMYRIARRMPPVSQHRLRKIIFAAVTEEEEKYLTLAHQ